MGYIVTVAAIFTLGLLVYGALKLTGIDKYLKEI
jgi:hypothetical protein